MPARVCRPMTCAVIATATALTVASDAALAAWSSLETIGAPAHAVLGADLAYWPDGTALVTWRDVPARTPTDEVANPGSALSYVAVRHPDGRRITRLTTHEEVVARAYGRGRLVVLRQRSAPVYDGRALDLGVSLGTRGRPLGARQRLVRSTPTREVMPGATVAASATGEIAVLWVERRRGERVRDVGRLVLRVALRPADGAFARPVTLATGDVISGLASIVATAAFGADGELLVAYAVDRRREDGRVGLVATRTRRAGSAFGPPRVIGAHGGSPRLAAALGPSGTAVVAWGSAPQATRTTGPWSVRAAVRGAQGQGFREAQVLDPGVLQGPPHPHELAVGISPDGTATVAWSTPVNAADDHEVRVATAFGGGRFAPATALGPGLGPDVAVRRDGVVLVAWRAPIGPTFSAAGGAAPGQQILAAVRSSLAVGFGPAEAVSPVQASGGLGLAGEPQAVFARRTGRAIVLWPAADLGGEPPQRLPGTAALHVAIRY